MSSPVVFSLKEGQDESEVELRAVYVSRQHAL